MLANQKTVSTARDRLNKQTKRDRPGGRPLHKIREIKLTLRECVLWFQRTRDGRLAHHQ